MQSNNLSEFKRGSAWRKWDLHIHTPASFGYTGNYDDLIKNLISSEAEVLGINDYCTFDGYEEIVKRGGINNKYLFPVVEFRMHNIIASRKGAAIQKGVRVNFHLIFNNNPDVLRRAKTWLSSLNCYNAQSNIDQLGNVVKVDIEKITLDFEEVIKSLEKINLRKDVLVWLPYDEYGGIDDIDPNDNFFKLGLVKRSNIIGSSTGKQINFFLWKDTKFKEEEYRNWFEKPLPCMKGSDSHESTYPVGRLRDKDSNPIEKYCWIKADPTFEGLRQITIEPNDRIYIGATPPKLADVEDNKSRYIDTIKIHNVNQNQNPSWFDAEIPLNNSLIAVIGKKGSGKSAMADIIALSGKSSVPPGEYSFLKGEKFRKKDLAKSYESSLLWVDGAKEQVNLNDCVDVSTEVEKVKYLPQHFVETICNENGVSKLFQQEIDKVIFSYVPLTERLNAKDLNGLITKKASVVDQLISELREELKGTNFEIVELEKKTSQAYKAKLCNQLTEKERELKALVEPKEVNKPAGDINVVAQKKAKELSEKIEELNKSIETETDNLTKLNNKIANVDRAKEGLQLLEIKINDYLRKLETSVKDFSLSLKDLVSFKINIDPLLKQEKEFVQAKVKVEEKLIQTDPNSKTSLYAQKDKLQKELETLTQSLNKDQKTYQEYLKVSKEFKEKQAKIIGDERGTNLTTITAIKKEISYLEKALSEDLNKLEENRVSIVKKIFAQLIAKIRFYKEIYQPLICFIEQEKELQERSGNILNFAVSLSFDRSKFSDKFFSFINQNRDGSFQGKENGQKILKSILDKFDFSKESDILNSIQEITRHLKEDITKTTANQMVIDGQFKADKKEFYDFLYSLEYLNVQYTIMFNGKDLNDNEFSPGEKGALLLIFYLLIDKNKVPLIMDQPEENLDNESVYVLLVPYIKKAKQNRQIVVITHNPNLAVVCDAEQIICASMNKRTNEICYTVGSIENPDMNKKVSDVLEGTLPAFDIRDEKYIREF